MKSSKLIELLQDAGGLPQVTIEHSSTDDWSRILMDAHADLTRQLCFHLERGNDRRVVHCLHNIEDICKAWRTKGPKE